MVNIGTAQVPVNQRTTLPANSVKVADVLSTLTPEQRQWTENVLKVLKLTSKGSQARLIAGAVAGAQVVSNDPNADNVTKRQADAALRAVLAAGDPPWKDAQKAQAAAAAKVQLDLLSIAGTPMVQLVDDKGINSSFWLQRKDADGAVRDSFLCKPKSTASAVVGVPAGGEVMREAIASRAAQHFAAMTGLDIGMPESHVVRIGVNQLPPGARPPNVTHATCSVQEALPSDGLMKNLDPRRRSQIPAEQVASLAMFDTMTLNVDRHRGNVMLDADNNLIPIDHGGSFPDPALGDSPTEVLNRIRVGLAGPHNALLSIPSAHTPLSPSTAKALSSMASSDYGNSLKEDRKAVVGQHPDQAGLLSDTAILAAQRSARFVKLAARMKPPLSPACIQVALGSEANPLLSPTLSDSEFEAAARGALERVVWRQEVVKDVCLASNTEYGALIRKVKGKGWEAFSRSFNGGQTKALSDPLVLLSILQLDLRRKPRAAMDSEEVKDSLMLARNKMPQEDDMRDLLASIVEEEVERLLPLLPTTERRAPTEILETLPGLSADERRIRSRALLDHVAETIQRDQAQRSAVLLAEHNVSNVTALGLQDQWTEGDWAAAADTLARMAEFPRKLQPQTPPQPRPDLRQAQRPQ